MLALVALLGDVSAGQSALVQGMRRIADLARINILGALYGTVFGLAIIYFRRDDWGVVVSLVCVAAMGTFDFMVVCQKNPRSVHRHNPAPDSAGGIRSLEAGLGLHG